MHFPRTVSMEGGRAASLRGGAPFPWGGIISMGGGSTVSKGGSTVYVGGAPSTWGSTISVGGHRLCGGSMTTAQMI